MQLAEKVAIFNKKKAIRQKAGTNEWLQRILIFLVVLSLCIVLVFPLLSLFVQAFLNEKGAFAGLENFIRYFQTPALLQSLQNTLFVSTLTTVLSVSLAFAYSYAIVRTNVKGKTFFRYSALLPLFAPTMMHGIALVYLFGNQGMVTNGFFNMLPGVKIDLYGPIGIVIAEVIYTFPQAFLIMVVALQGSDNRLYEAADTMGANNMKKFFVITLPSVKYGLISSLFVVFTLSFTDYGAPKILGGQYDVLATDVYKQVIGQQNMAMGAAVGMILMLPAVFAFGIDQFTQRKQVNYLTSKSVPYQLKKNKRRDILAFFYCSGISMVILILMLSVLLAASVKIWPYDLSLTIEHFQFNSFSGDGLSAYKNSLIASALTAVFGTIFTFIYAYVIEKFRRMTGLRKISYFLSILPLAVPGLVIGLSYIFFFSKQDFTLFGFELSNPFNFLYGTIAIIVIANIVHFYSVTFITATTALKKLDKEYDLVSESMGVPFYKTFFTITLPMCLPAILEMAMYYFVNAMVTVSAVIFLYSADFKLAAISIVNMDDAGNVASAAAMSVLIVVTNIAVRIIYEVSTKAIRKRSAIWQKS
ncbi:putative 2-aminoethylphosphonate ABC transporter permease subunit [Metabacillus arenae]|uniref:2-aminoethylphosphonate ABC transporter permease subunit n=1 Tax=Metabacillus arenae TaxID=2771434 RepID=A0A926NQH7_9BACI|nr:putative 2-aminoethylphosphonate ABC transporter permease subunit [Metabacillus arenae]MBD1382167.1 putative 2-aminoethylphosphonate ABC transporter permease subunit [Metabacillus arenae]